MASSRRLSLSATVLLLMMTSGPAWPAPPPVAGQIINLSGRVEVQRGSAKPLAATLLFPLQPADVLRVGDGGSAEVVLFQKGARFRLAGPGSAKVGADTLTPIAGTKPRALTDLSPTFARRLKTPARQASPQIMGVVVRGGNEPGLGPSRPTPNGSVRSTPVTLRWSGVIDASQLHVQISAGEEDVDHQDLRADAREYTVPDSKLKPGKVYDWSVISLRGAAIGNGCRATVRVLLPAEVAEVAAIEKECANAAPDDPATLLLLATAYERFDLKEDALAKYQAVLRLRPGDAGVQAAVKRLSGGGS